MIKQTIYLSSGVEIYLRQRQLVIKTEEGEITRPIEDIGTVILENPQIRCSAAVLNYMVESGTMVVLCNNKQMPSALMMPLDANNTQAETMKVQTEATEPCKKQIWKRFVEAKIRNQSSVLNLFDKDGDKLKPYYSNVKSGDSDNREGLAARIYWKELFGSGFVRDREGESPNNFLNYGYMVLRAATAKALLGSGLYPGFGIFHRNRYNAFPLADDVMEPYRPFVDDYVYKLYQMGERLLYKRTKSELLKVLSCDVRIGGVTRPLQIALRSTTASLVGALRGDVKQLKLPEIIT